MQTKENQYLSKSTHRALMPALLAALAILAYADPVWAQTTVNVTFDNSASILSSTERANITAQLQEAARTWAGYLAIDGQRSIEALVLIGSIPTANGASATSSYVGEIGGLATYEMGVAHELRTGIDPNGANPDALITYGLDYLRNELWFDPDPTARTAPVPSNLTDAMSVALHEFGHAIAYSGWVDLNGGSPTQAYWSVWDSWILSGSAPAFGGPAAMAAWSHAPPALTIGNINHWGNPAQAMTGGIESLCSDAPVASRGGIPTPRACAAPPSADLSDREPAQAYADSDLIYQLMNGVVFYRGSRYYISGLDLGVLQDVGLPVDSIFANGFEAG